MEIEVNSNTSIKEIQDKFNILYPFLWIDFLYQPFTEENLVRFQKINPVTQLKSIENFSGIKTINLDGDNTVTQLEEYFWLSLKLTAKILRKSGKVLIGTSYTGNWTLDSQNFEAGQLLLD